MPTLTLDQAVLLALLLGWLCGWFVTALRREQVVAALERQLADDDATIREQRERIIQLHRALAGEEEAGQYRDQIIDALGTQVLNASPFRVIDGGR